LNHAYYHFWEIPVKKSCFWILLVYLFCFSERISASESKYLIWENGSDSSKNKVFQLEDLESKGKQIIRSSYFDRGMGLKETRLTVVPFKRMLEIFPPSNGMDSILMDGEDDYQAIISLDYGKKYNLYWATKIQVSAGEKKPDWMNPLALVVPDSSSPPDVERFLPANIKNLRYVRWEDYYKPITAILKKYPKQGKLGFEAFGDDCLYCHSLRGIGGNKGGDLTKKFQLSSQSGQKGFVQAFGIKHYNKGQYSSVEEFLRKKKARKIAEFLSVIKNN
jgi:hypothetical protein